MTTTERVNEAAAGRDNGVVIYWDAASYGDAGTAYRDGQESGAIECVGWSGPIAGDNTLNVSDFFCGGRYLGPDKDGRHPIFVY